MVVVVRYLSILALESNAESKNFREDVKVIELPPMNPTNCVIRLYQMLKWLYPIVLALDEQDPKVLTKAIKDTRIAHSL